LVHVKYARQRELTEPAPVNERSEGRLAARVGDGGVMKGESSVGSDCGIFIGDEGRDALGVLAEDGGDNRSSVVY
jgi:hypothetical protein